MLKFILLFTKRYFYNRIAIYGAGVGGAQLAASLRITGDYEILTFIDDNPDLWNRTLNSIPIRNPKNLRNIISDLDKNRIINSIKSNLDSLGIKENSNSDILQFTNLFVEISLVCMSIMIISG